jgi:hypothetical protein
VEDYSRDLMTDADDRPALSVREGDMVSEENDDDILSSCSGRSEDDEVSEDCPHFSFLLSAVLTCLISPTLLVLQATEVPFQEREALSYSGVIPKVAMGSLLKKNKSRTFKRENKNRPVEMSSKRPVSRLREAIPIVKR